jgi:hypothetical protein
MGRGIFSCELGERGDLKVVGRDMGEFSPKGISPGALHAPEKGRENFIYTRECWEKYLGSCLESGGKFWGCLGELGNWVGIEEMRQGNSFLWEMSARLIGEIVALFWGSD